MHSELDPISGGVEVIHGVPVADPYRWLENRSSLETEQWIAKQRACFEGYLLKLGSLEGLKKRVIDFTDVETVDEIGKVEGRYFYRKRGIAEQQPSIFVMDSLESSERSLVDSSGQDPYMSVGIHRVSADGSLLAYEVKRGGEHTKAIHIVDVNTGSVFPDHLAHGLARGFIFRNARDGFYYCHEFADDPDCLNKPHVVRLHRFGTSVGNDVVLLTLPRTRSSKLVLIYEGAMLGAVYGHEHHGVAVVDLYVASQDRDDIWKCVCQNVSAPFSPFFHHGSLFAHQFAGTQYGEIVELDSTSGRPTRVVVPEWHARIMQCAIAMDRLHVSYLVGGETVVRRWSLPGDYLGTFPLEEGCSWSLVPGYTNDVDELFLQYESFTKPPTLLRWLPRTDDRVVWSRCNTPDARISLVVRKLTYSSNDGTEIAINLVGPEDESRLRHSPTIMTAYGGFGITMTPQFSTFVSVMLELGFVFALPEIRGGGERGKSWHEAARGRNRQVAFDDFIASAEWLCEKGFTSPQKLAIFGGSNSGILVGAAITQRPDLFRAALCIAPLLDMVRYHLFDRAHVWANEYGTADDPDDFRALLAYSPYHHVGEDTNYPAVLFVCGDRDSRCNPAHARKMAARLEDRRAQENAILIDYSEERGHSPTMPLSVRVDGLTHRIAFLCHELGVPIHQEAQHDTVSC
jgi:prolyl oligopeptidase